MKKEIQNIKSEDDITTQKTDFSDISFMQKFVKKNNRTRMHNLATINWLQKRHQNSTHTKYLYMPQQLIKELQIKKIFQIFDTDGSNSLDLHEMVEMLSKYQIHVDKEELGKLYKVVDENNDDALDFKQFKECTVSSTANQVFSDIMHKVEQESVDRNVYLPRTFPALVTYIGYLITRDNLNEGMKDSGKNVKERFEKFIEMFRLDDLNLLRQGRIQLLTSNINIKAKLENSAMKNYVTNESSSSPVEKGGFIQFQRKSMISMQEAILETNLLQYQSGGSKHSKVDGTLGGPSSKSTVNNKQSLSSPGREHEHFRTPQSFRTDSSRSNLPSNQNQEFQKIQKSLDQKENQEGQQIKRFKGTLDHLISDNDILSGLIEVSTIEEVQNRNIANKDNDQEAKFSRHEIMKRFSLVELKEMDDFYNASKRNAQNLKDYLQDVVKEAQYKGKEEAQEIISQVERSKSPEQNLNKMRYFFGQNKSQGELLSNNNKMRPFTQMGGPQQFGDFNFRSRGSELPEIQLMSKTGVKFNSKNTNLSSMNVPTIEDQQAQNVSVKPHTTGPGNLNYFFGQKFNLSRASQFSVSSFNQKSMPSTQYNSQSNSIWEEPTKTLNNSPKNSKLPEKSTVPVSKTEKFLDSTFKSFKNKMNRTIASVTEEFNQTALTLNQQNSRQMEQYFPQSKEKIARENNLIDNIKQKWRENFKINSFGYENKPETASPASKISEQKHETMTQSFSQQSLAQKISNQTDNAALNSETLKKEIQRKFVQGRKINIITNLQPTPIKEDAGQSFQYQTEKQKEISKFDASSHKNSNLMKIEF